MGDRIAFLGMDEAWKEDGITNEENWCVVSNEIPVAFFSIEFDSESARITRSVSWTAFSANSRKSDGDWSLFSDLGENSRFAVLADVVSNLKVSKGT